MAQHPMKVVLLDLDGTLTKSDGGIIASVVKTFEELGRPVPDDAELHRFIGPAIIESLRRNHVPEDELDRAVTIYRSYYADRAVFDDPNEPGNIVPGRLGERRVSRYPRTAAQAACRRLLSGVGQLQARVPMRSDL